MKKNSLTWLKKEIHKDELELKHSKKDIINKIKKSGKEGVFYKPKIKEKNTIWKKLKNLISF
jgi:hypothetical protein